MPQPPPRSIPDRPSSPLPIPTFMVERYAQENRSLAAARRLLVVGRRLESVWPDEVEFAGNE